MRRRAGELIPIEQAILECGIELTAAGDPGFYGFAIAKHIRDASGARQLTAHGTLYKALGRLEQDGLLASSWEDPGVAEAEARPRRRLYRVTPSGERAVQPSAAARPQSAAGAQIAPRPGTAQLPPAGPRQPAAPLPRTAQSATAGTRSSPSPPNPTSTRCWPSPRQA